ncbi:MAG: flagellar basal body rod protein FlgC [Armatimonadetes bacterium]|nr:flagellar basal body rod protein FlgC [Armatimonadota bacterium]
MSFFSSMDISASGMSAERFKMDIIANNIANVNTTDAQGNPYRAKMAVITPADRPEFVVPVGMDEGEEEGINFSGLGVKVAGVEESKEPLKYVYDPDNPRAIKEGKWKGYVAMPNINIIEEMTSLIMTSRTYEANATAIEAAKSMAQRALEIGRQA